MGQQGSVHKTNVQPHRAGKNFMHRRNQRTYTARKEIKSLYENTRKFRRLIKEETKGSRYRGNVVFPIKLILNFDRTEFTVLERQNNIVEVEGAA